MILTKLDASDKLVDVMVLPSVCEMEAKREIGARALDLEKSVDFSDKGTREDKNNPAKPVLPPQL